MDPRDATRGGVNGPACRSRGGGKAPYWIDRPPCTRCEAERFFSYRRDGQNGGVHMAFIGLV